MKLANLLTVLLLIFIASSLNAQTMKTFKKEISKIVSATSLDEAQIGKLNKIYEKRVADLLSIQDLEATNEAKFRDKRRAIYQGAEVSIKLILTREQLELFKNYNRGVRIDRARKIQKLRKKDAPMDDILDAQYGVK